jgi:hypothetical protein
VVGAAILEGATRKSVIIAISAASLAGCAGMQPSGISPGDIGAAITAACGFVADNSVLLDLAATVSPGIGVAEKLATRVCAAVKRRGTTNALRARPPRVNGVLIRGHF